MAINSNEAYGLEQFGVIFTGPDGDVSLYIVGGVGSPVGQQAPVPTLYIDEQARIWRKFGPLVTDWVLQEAGSTPQAFNCFRAGNATNTDAGSGIDCAKGGGADVF